MASAAGPWPTAPLRGRSLTDGGQNGSEADRRLRPRAGDSQDHGGHDKFAGAPSQPWCRPSRSPSLARAEEIAAEPFQRVGESPYLVCSVRWRARRGWSGRGTASCWAPTRGCRSTCRGGCWPIWGCDRRWGGVDQRSGGAAGPARPVRADHLDTDGVAGPGPGDRRPPGRHPAGPGGGPGSGVGSGRRPRPGRRAAPGHRRHHPHRPFGEGAGGTDVETDVWVPPAGVLLGPARDRLG